jgi:hypothetical protein
MLQKGHSTRNLPIDGTVKIGIPFILRGWEKIGKKNDPETFRIIALIV